MNIPYCRAKSIETNQIRYGYYWQNCDAHFLRVSTKQKDSGIVVTEDVEIDPETIQLFTGLYSREGSPIFEGDTVVCDEKFQGVVSFGYYAASGCDHNTNYGFYVAWQNADYFRKEIGYWIEQKDCIFECTGVAFDGNRSYRVRLVEDDCEERNNAIRNMFEEYCEIHELDIRNKTRIGPDSYIYRVDVLSDEAYKLLCAFEGISYIMVTIPVCLM